MQTIQIDNKELPIRFDFNTLREFGKLTGITRLADLQSIGDNITLDQTLTLIYCGIKQGCRRDGIEFKYTIEEIADCISDNGALIGETMQMFHEDRAPVEEQKKSDQVTDQ